MFFRSFKLHKWYQIGKASHLLMSVSCYDTVVEHTWYFTFYVNTKNFLYVSFWELQHSVWMHLLRNGNLAIKLKVYISGNSQKHWFILFGREAFEETEIYHFFPKVQRSEETFPLETLVKLLKWSCKETCSSYVEGIVNYRW